VKSITVAIDDETYRRARVAAAKRDTSVSALVKAYLSSLSSVEDEFEALERRELELREQIKEFSASDRLSRDEVHDRKY
jgi:Family of unknown function (DUF6364)